MLPVTSSNILEIGFQPTEDNDTVGQFYVTFRNGSMGYYDGVPIDIFRQVRDAPSKGKALNELVKKQGYPFYLTSAAPGEVGPSASQE